MIDCICGPGRQRQSCVWLRGAQNQKHSRWRLNEHSTHHIYTVHTERTLDGGEGKFFDKTSSTLVTLIRGFFSTTGNGFRGGGRELCCRLRAKSPFSRRACALKFLLPNLFCAMCRFGGEETPLRFLPRGTTRLGPLFDSGAFLVRDCPSFCSTDSNKPIAVSARNSADFK